MKQSEEWKLYDNVGTEIKPKYLRALHPMTNDISYCITNRLVSTYNMGGFMHSYFQVALVNTKKERVAQATVSMFARLNDELYTEQQYYYAFDSFYDDVANMSHMLRHYLLPKQGLRMATAVNVFAIEVERKQPNKEYLEQLIIEAIDCASEAETLHPTQYWLFDFNLDMSDRSELARQAQVIRTSDYWKATAANAAGFYSYLKDDGVKYAYRKYKDLIFSF